jgi:TonB-dependent SusC/RagA subfamily outer membrane receptor
MTLLVVYSLTVGLLLAGAGHFIDDGLRALGRQTRWVWLLAMTTTVVLPLAYLWNPSSTSPDTPRTSVPMEFLYQGLVGSVDGIGGLVSPGLVPDGPLVALWIMASSLVLLGLIGISLRLRRRARSWPRKRVGDLEVLVSEALGPAVLGVIRPVIVLPRWVLALDPEKLDMILLHEGEHRGARDPALLAWAVMLVALVPWNPALWWMLRRFHLAVEADCDGRVLARGVLPGAYGSLLLDMASESRRLAWLTPTLAEGRKTLLERRLSMLRSNVRRHPFRAAIAAFAVGAAFIILACETPTPPASVELSVDLQASQLPKEVPAGENGYYLYKKEGGKLEYVRSLADGEMEALEGSAVERKEPAGFVVRKIQENDGGPEAVADPLIIIDGVISDLPVSEIQGLGPDRIESIEVIKGAAAEALYGERAAGGVINITTRK